MKKTKLILTIATIGSAISIPTVSLSSCNKAELLSIKVEVKDRDLTKALPVCYTVHKSDIKVTGKFSNGSEGEITDWISEDFGYEDHITFYEEGVYDIYIKVGTKFKEKLTFIIQESVPAQVSHLIMTLGCGDNFTTGQKLEVYSGDIKLEPKDFNYTPDNSIKDYVSIDNTTGLVSIKSKPGTKVEGDISITRKLPTNGKNAYDSCHVVIDTNLFTMKDSYYDDYYETATVGINGADSTGVISIPETVTKGNKTYTVTSIAKGGDNIKNVKLLSLPITIESIPSNLFNDEEYKLNTILYCGTKKEWDQNVYLHTGRDWAGYLAMGVTCYDGMYLFNHRQESQYYAQKEYGQETYDVLAMPNPVGGVIGQSYAVKLLYSQLEKPGKTANNFNNIYFRDSSWGSLGAIHVDYVFLDGVLLDDDNTKNNWYEFSNNTITINSKTGYELSYDSEVVIHFRTPTLFAKDSIHVAAIDPNA